jgi:hypothetical protein
MGDDSGSSDRSSQHDYSALDSDLDYQEIVPGTLEHDTSDEDDNTDLIDSQPIHLQTIRCFYHGIPSGPSSQVYKKTQASAAKMSIPQIVLVHSTSTLSFGILMFGRHWPTTSMEPRMRQLSLFWALHVCPIPQPEMLHLHSRSLDC